jgi:hypothetical protein
MYAAHPGGDPERFHLRILLAHVPGATCYEHLQGGHATFKEACLARGLLQDDSEWAACMEEAVSYQHPGGLRELFAALLVFNNVAEPAALWDRFKADLCEDFLHAARQVNASRQLDDQLHDMALREIEKHLRQMGGQSPQAYSLPAYTTTPPVFGMVGEEQARFPMQEQAANLRAWI